jgi:hypothetical protein
VVALGVGQTALTELGERNDRCVISTPVSVQDTTRVYTAVYLVEIRGERYFNSHIISDK